MSKEYYSLLEIDSSATEADIKKAYRKLAMKHHPDKGGDTETFQGIQKAYEVLSDPEKRKIYDLYGEKGLESNGVPQNPFDWMDLMRFKYASKQKEQATVAEYYIDLEDFYNRREQQFEWKRKVHCQECSTKTCVECRGLGMKTNVIRQGNFIQHSQISCSTCSASGVVYDKNCVKCHGVGIVVKKMKATFQPQVGVWQFVLPEQGNHTNPNYTAGDIILQLKPKNVKNFQIDQFNLIYTHTTSLYDAITGCQFEIPHFNNETLSVKMQSVVTPDLKHTIVGKGLPKNNGEYGDLIVVFHVDFPEKLVIQHDALRELLK